MTPISVKKFIEEYTGRIFQKWYAALFLKTSWGRTQDIFLHFILGIQTFLFVWIQCSLTITFNYNGSAKSSNFFQRMKTLFSFLSIKLLLPNSKILSNLTHIWNDLTIHIRKERIKDVRRSHKQNTTIYKIRENHVILLSWIYFYLYLI